MRSEQWHAAETTVTCPLTRVWPIPTCSVCRPAHTFLLACSYVQFVQTLVDILVFLAPFALYPKVGAWSVPLAALLAYFYCGRP